MTSPSSRSRYPYPAVVTLLSGKLMLVVLLFLFAFAASPTHPARPEPNLVTITGLKLSLLGLKARNKAFNDSKFEEEQQRQLQAQSSDKRQSQSLLGRRSRNDGQRESHSRSRYEVQNLFEVARQKQQKYLRVGKGKYNIHFNIVPKNKNKDIKMSHKTVDSFNQYQTNAFCTQLLDNKLQKQKQEQKSGSGSGEIRQYNYNLNKHEWKRISLNSKVDKIGRGIQQRGQMLKQEKLKQWNNNKGKLQRKNKNIIAITKVKSLALPLLSHKHSWNVASEKANTTSYTTPKSINIKILKNEVQNKKYKVVNLLELPKQQKQEKQNKNGGFHFKIQLGDPNHNQMNLNPTSNNTGTDSDNDLFSFSRQQKQMETQANNKNIRFRPSMKQRFYQYRMQDYNLLWLSLSQDGLFDNFTSSDLESKVQNSDQHEWIKILPPPEDQSQCKTQIEQEQQTQEAQLDFQDFKLKANNPKIKFKKTSSNYKQPKNKSKTKYTNKSITISKRDRQECKQSRRASFLFQFHKHMVTSNAFAKIALSQAYFSQSMFCFCDQKKPGLMMQYLNEKYPETNFDYFSFATATDSFTGWPLMRYGNQVIFLRKFCQRYRLHLLFEGDNWFTEVGVGRGSGNSLKHKGRIRGVLLIDVSDVKSSEGEVVYQHMTVYLSIAEAVVEQDKEKNRDLFRLPDFQYDLYNPSVLGLSEKQLGQMSGNYLRSGARSYMQQRYRSLKPNYDYNSDSAPQIKMTHEQFTFQVNNWWNKQNNNLQKFIDDNLKWDQEETPFKIFVQAALRRPLDNSEMMRFINSCNSWLNHNFGLYEVKGQPQVQLQKVQQLQKYQQQGMTMKLQTQSNDNIDNISNLNQSWIRMISPPGPGGNGKLNNETNFVSDNLDKFLGDLFKDSQYDQTDQKNIDQKQQRYQPIQIKPKLKLEQLQQKQKQYTNNNNNTLSKNFYHILSNNISNYSNYQLQPQPQKNFNRFNEFLVRKNWFAKVALSQPDGKWRNKRFYNCSMSRSRSQSRNENENNNDHVEFDKIKKGNQNQLYYRRVGYSLMTFMEQNMQVLTEERFLNLLHRGSVFDIVEEYKLQVEFKDFDWFGDDDQIQKEVVQKVYKGQIKQERFHRWSFERFCRKYRLHILYQGDKKFTEVVPQRGVSSNVTKTTKGRNKKRDEKVVAVLLIEQQKHNFTKKQQLELKQKHNRKFGCVLHLTTLEQTTKQKAEEQLYHMHMQQQQQNQNQKQNQKQQTQTLQRTLVSYKFPLFQQAPRSDQSVVEFIASVQRQSEDKDLVLDHQQVNHHQVQTSLGQKRNHHQVQDQEKQIQSAAFNEFVNTYTQLIRGQNGIIRSQFGPMKDKDVRSQGLLVQDQVQNHNDTDNFDLRKSQSQPNFVNEVSNVTVMMSMSESKSTLETQNLLIPFD